MHLLFFQGILSIEYLDANFWRGGRSRSLGQVTVLWEVVGAVPGRWRCARVLYSARPTGGRGQVPPGLLVCAVFAPT
jgi:hypothetical protein